MIACKLLVLRILETIYIKKVKLATVVEGDQKAPFSIATTLRCRERCYSFHRIVPLYPWYVPLYCWMLSKEVSSTIFKVFGLTWPGIEPRSPRPLANTLLARPIYLLYWNYIIICFKNWSCKYLWMIIISSLKPYNCLHH